jgi:4-hydroxy-tetrahydrodipicolinate synthase
VPCPLILYNNPITTKFSIPIDVIEKLSYHPNIAGIKDSERGMERLDLSLKLWYNRPDFVHFTGWAAQSAYALLNGSDGIIPSTGNFCPELYSELYHCALQRNAEKANALQSKADQISEIYQKDRNVSQSIPALKVMMSSKGLCKTFVMPPMYELSSEENEKIKNAVLRTEY